MNNLLFVQVCPDAVAARLTRVACAFLSSLQQYRPEIIVDTIDLRAAARTGDTAVIRKGDQPRHMVELFSGADMFVFVVSDPGEKSTLILRECLSLIVHATGGDAAAGNAGTEFLAGKRAVIVHGGAECGVGGSNSGSPEEQEAKSPMETMLAEFGMDDCRSLAVAAGAESPEQDGVSADMDVDLLHAREMAKKF